jgi:hypothetical protein
MTVAEEHMRRSVDEVLEPAWPRERRRAARRLGYRTLRRIAGGCLALWGLGFLVHLVVGGSFPWASFGLIALLSSVAASTSQGDRTHLRRD